MTKQEQEVSEQLANLRKELYSLIRKINDFETDLQRINANKEDVLGAYKSDIKEQGYQVDCDGSICDRYYGRLDDDDDNHPYCDYPSVELAKQAQRIKDFNDKLLAFKYCYDRDYEPDWENEDEKKYYIYYDNDDNHYDWGRNTLYDNNAIYFSSHDIAHKCCDWLNSISE